ncbi:site-specific recombinase XerD [Salana multivorans]|uniref:Site-specific recombinase XerD n=1 Tax=Salana multivorans TaxID=120377 RepID=A0A3N2D1Z7_9MICO|nr:tyrosine-type recombinase/integrase [Salana multivorans]ROR93802.1 site-specific recombinase XerD [Salana multivorans]
MDAITAGTAPATQLLPWPSEIAAFCTAMAARRLSPETITLRRYHLQRLAREIGTETPWTLTADDLLQWTGEHDWKRETARAVRSSLRRFWDWGHTTGRTQTNPAALLPAIRPDQPTPRPATPGTVNRALKKATARVELMLRFANELGMRRGEVARIHPHDDLIRTASGWSLVVHGKGDRERTLPLPTDLAKVLRDAPDGYLFPGAENGHVSAHWVGTLVSRALGDGTTMHQLRHLCATEIHDQTRDLRLVQTLLGHASLATTQRYIAVDDKAMRRAVAARSRRWNPTEHA